MDLFAADSMDADREFNYTSEMACHRPPALHSSLAARVLISPSLEEGGTS